MSKGVVEQVLVLTLERVFNLLCGFTPESDWLPERFYRDPITVEEGLALEFPTPSGKVEFFSEQLDTKLVLAADEQTAAGLLIQRLPVEGEGNLEGGGGRCNEDEIGLSEAFNRAALLR